LEVSEKGEKISNAHELDVYGFNIFLPSDDLLDFDAEKKRLSKEITELENYVLTLDKKLKNEGFTKNAPKEVLAAEQKKLEETAARLEKLKGQLGELGN